MKFTIYKLINNKTGRTYTGCTRAPKTRVADHFSQLKRGKHSCKEMQKDFNNGDDFSFQYVKQFEEDRFDNAMLIEEQYVDKNTYNIRRNVRAIFQDGWIKKDVLLLILKDFHLKVRLVQELDISIITIDRWLQKNSIKLTQAAALKVIREELQLTDSQILEETKKQNA